MSGKTKRSRKPDSRVRRTRDALGDALVALMQEKPFDSITVQHILDRAEIGRSTFYSHYLDKNDLFLSDLEDFFEGMSTLLLRRREDSNRVVPVCELFAHIAEMRTLYTALVAADKQHEFFELAQGYFARAIDQRLAQLASTRAIAPARRSAMAHAFAGAFLSLLSWWIAQPTPPSAEDMDQIFHQMVWSGVNAKELPTAKASDT
jgi:AcrR family transcriptional regulator